MLAVQRLCRIVRGAPEITRAFSGTARLKIKQIDEVQQGSELTISAKILPSEREPYLLKQPHSSGACPVCASGLDIKHTDVLILSQFVRRDGCMLPRRITGLCRKQQKRMSDMVTMAHKAGLMPNLKPGDTYKDPRKRKDWKKNNMYFDEATIEVGRKKKHEKSPYWQETKKEDSCY